MLVPLALSANGAISVGCLDATRAGDYSPQFGASMSAFRANLATNFPGAAFSSTSTLTSGFLNSVDVLVLSAVFGSTTEITPLNSAEQAALLNFVLAGGAALLFTDNSFQFQSAGQSLVTAFGVNCTGLLPGSVSATVTNLSHPVANGPFGAVTSYTIASYPGWFDTLGPDATGVAVLDPNNQASLAATAPGALASASGGVVFFSDTTIDNGSFYGSVVTLVDNALSYVLADRIRPILSITQSNSFLIVSWATNVFGYRLQQSANPASGVWTDQPLTGPNQAAMAVTNSQAFFRLIKPWTPVTDF